MKPLVRIQTIKARTDALRLTVAEICARAEPPVSASSVSRWLAGVGKSGPRMHIYDDFCTRLEAALDRMEAEELARLSGRSAAAVTATVAK